MTDYKQITLDEIGSTNMFALCNIEQIADKTVICAKKQTNGRGRLNRHWICDNSENVYMSIVIKPQDFNKYPVLNVTQYLSVILTRVLKQNFSINAQIKWPNDVLIDGYKIAGILAETSVKDNQIKAIVLGLGVNINMPEETLRNIDKKATSLFELTGKEHSSSEFIRLISEEFFRHYDEFVHSGFMLIRDEYLSRACFLNRRMKIENGTRTGEFLINTVNEQGMLIAQNSHNEIQTVISGDLI